MNPQGDRASELPWKKVARAGANEIMHTLHHNTWAYDMREQKKKCERNESDETIAARRDVFVTIKH